MAEVSDTIGEFKGKPWTSVSGNARLNSPQVFSTDPDRVVLKVGSGSVTICGIPFYKGEYTATEINEILSLKGVKDIVGKELG